MKRTAWLLALLLSAWPSGAAIALQGDVTDDGFFDLEDPLALCQYLSGRIPSLAAARNGDVNFDGEVDAVDLDLMMEAMIGLPLPSQALAVAPTGLDFGSVTIGSEAALDVVVSNGGGAAITLQSIALAEGTPETFSVASAPATPADLAAGAGVTITVRFAPASAGGAIGSLVILSTGGDAEVGIAGTGAAGLLAVAPLVIDFGQVPTGDLLHREITIWNAGSADIEVTDIATGSGTDPALTIEYAPSTPFALAPGRQRTVRIAYAPEAAGLAAGTIEIVSTAGSAVVSLEGTATEPAP